VRRALSGVIEERLSNVLLRGFFNVNHEHGHGFLEPVYANALAVELQFLGLKVQREAPVTVRHRGVDVGRYRIDLLVENRILVEVKAQSKLVEADQRQLLNYLKATPYELGFLLNFGPKPEFLRRLLTNDRKHAGQAV
jgi:GxxExxY protein